MGEEIVKYLINNARISECFMIPMEECNELSKALSKYYRNPTGEGEDNIIEEIADVLICIDMLKELCQFIDEDINKIKAIKEERNMIRIKNEEF